MIGPGVSLACRPQADRVILKQGMFSSLSVLADHPQSKLGDLEIDIYIYNVCVYIYIYIYIHISNDHSMTQLCLQKCAFIFCSLSALSLESPTCWIAGYKNIISLLS